MRVHINGEGEHAFCMDPKCETTWEPFNPEDLAIPDDRFSVFVRPCDNCAFRPGSPERENPEKWELLQQRIHLGGAVFYCHKGVPVSDGDEESHDHFKTESGALDKAKLRECAGWLATRLAAMRKEMPRA